MKSLKFLSILCTLCVTMIFVSCGDDEITGCTDPAAENYDATATLSDNTTCVYAADKFVGDYFGSSDCMGGFILPGLTNDSLMFSVDRAVGGGPNDVTVSLPIQGTPVAFASSVDGDNLTVDALLEGLPFPNPLGGDPINVDVEADGLMTYTSADDSTSGTINITIRDSATGSTLDIGSCVITGVKQ